MADSTVLWIIAGSIIFGALWISFFIAKLCDIFSQIRTELRCARALKESREDRNVPE